MSFDWRDYVELAEDLLNETEESCYRTSVSRAYYGVFCTARNKKGYQNYQAKWGENIHRIVIDVYKNSPDRSEKNIGRILDSLRRSRNDADYNENKLINKDYAKRAVGSAKIILTSLDPI